MSIGEHVYPTIDALTKPNLPFRVGTGANSTSIRTSSYRHKTYAAGQPKCSVWLATIGAYLLADGYSPMRILKDDEWYRVGILPPDPTTMTAVPTGAKAAAALTLTGDPNNGDAVTIGGPTGAPIIYFVTSLVTDPTASGYRGWQVLIAPGNPTQTMQNLADLVNNASGENTRWHNPYKALGFPVYTFSENWTTEATPATVPGGGPVTLQATMYGTVGNSLIANTVFDTAAVQTWTLGSPNFTGGADGSGTAPGEGTYQYAFRYYRKGDRAFSGIGRTVEASIGVAMNIDLTMADPSDDPQITQLQWMRSLVASGQFYAGDTVDVGTGATDTDDKLDTQIAVSLPYNDLEFRPYESGHVPSYRCAEMHLGSVFAGGAFLMRDTAISLDLTEDSYSATVTAGTQVWSSDMEGGIIVFDDFGGEEYIVVDYDHATQTVRLNKAWPHATATETGTWRDGRNPSLIAWSVPGKPNQFPPANELGGVTDETGEGITGLKSHWSRLNVFTPESIHALSGTHGAFQLRRVVEGIGSVSHHGIVEAEGMLFFPGQGAFYAWAGDETPINITFPPGEPRGLATTMGRVNWKVADQITGYFDEFRRCVIWDVPLDGAWAPNASLVFDLQTREWHLDFGLTPDRRITVSRGGQHYQMAIRQGRALFHDLDGVDNYYHGAHRTTIASISEINNTITISDPPGTLIAKGITSAIIVTQAGEYIPVTLIGGASGAFLADRDDLVGRVAVGDQVLLGGILFWKRTGGMSFGSMARESRITDLDLAFVPQTHQGRFYAAIGADSGDPTLPEFGAAYADYTESDGHVRFSLNSKGRLHVLDLIAAFPGGYPEVVELNLGVRAASKNKVNL